MAGQAVDGHMLLRQNVHADLQRGHGGVELGAEEVCQGKSGVGTAGDQRTACVHMGHALTCHVVAHQHTAAVGIAFQRVLVQLGVQLPGGGGGTKQGGSFFQNAHPGVGIVGAVVAVNHGHGLAGGGGDHVDLLIDLAQVLFQNNHGEDGGAGGNVAGSGGNGVGGGHAGSGVALGRSHRNAGRQEIVQLRGALGGEAAGILTGYQHGGQHLPDVPGQVPGGQHFFHFRQHFLVVAVLLTVDGEHTRGLADAQGVDAGEHEVNVAGQGGDVADLGNVRLVVQNGLIQVGDGPPLGDVEAEGLGQLGSGVGGNGILPGAEGHQQIPVFVKGKVAVHHGGNAHGGYRFPVFHAGNGGLQALPDLVQRVGPDAVHKGAFPSVIAGGNGIVLCVDGNSLDTGGAQLEAQNSFIHHEILPHSYQIPRQPGESARCIRRG